MSLVFEEFLLFLVDLAVTFEVQSTESVFPIIQIFMQVISMLPGRISALCKDVSWRVPTINANILSLQVLSHRKPLRVNPPENLVGYPVSTEPMILPQPPLSIPHMPKLNIILNNLSNNVSLDLIPVRPF